MASTDPVIESPTEPSVKLPTEVPAETHTESTTTSLPETAKDFVPETPTEPSSETFTERTTESSVKPVSMPTFETATKEPTKSSSHTTNGSVSEASHKVTTEPYTESCTSPTTVSCVEPVAMPVSETATETTTESSTHTANDPISDTSTKLAIKASLELPSPVATDSYTAPTTESCIEPVNMATTETTSEPAAESLTQSASVPISGTSKKLSAEASTEPTGEDPIKSGDDSSTENPNKSRTKDYITIEHPDTASHLARMEELRASGMLTRRSTVPCSACSFSPERQRCCNYESHVKLFYEAGDRGVWALGSQLILKDRGPSCPTDENANLCFVKKNTTIPIPTVIAHHEEGDGHALTIMTRIPGENLSEAWSKLTDDQKDNIAKETAEYLLQLRSLQSDRLECLDGRPVFNKYRRGEDNCDSAQDPTSDDYVWNRLAASLDPAVPEAVRCRLRRSMPPTQPFTYTHNDLTHINIMVQNGKLSGIIDWEAAGYYPVWWEYTRTIVTSEGLEDMKWKSLLRQYMPKTREAKCWYLDWFWLCHGVDNERAKELIQEVEENRSEDGVTEKDESEMGEAEEDESDKDDSTEDESMEHKS